MQYVFRIIGLVLALLISACSAVYTTVPVGDTVVQLNPEEWQGTWLSHEMVVVTTVLDAEKGLLQVAWIERRTEGATLEKQESTIRSTGEWVFANARDQEADELRYLWVRMDREGSKLITWVPRLDGFVDLVKEGELPGAVIDEGVVLGELTEENLKMINDPSSHLFDWDEPRVFIRIAD